VLDEHPELVDAAGFGTVLALENRRLDETLRRSIEDLDASHVRLVTAVAEERRRIERDIHDGSQQRLLAIRIQLELARSRAIADPDTLERLAELGDELDAALDELRAIAHGIYPALLGEEGLRPALTEAATRCGALVDLDLSSLGRYEGEIEAAVYFSCVEALQNVSKHAGTGAHVHLRVWEAATSVNFTVSDDGVGFESPGDGGSGLSNMSDRLRALGGSLSVAAEPQHGTTVAGTLPVSRALLKRR
jgi:signal transduction histidine kinase